MNFKSLTLSMLSAAFLVGCGKDDKNADEKGSVTEAEELAVIHDIVNNVVIPTYKDLNDKTTVLKASLDALRANPTAETLEKAREAWRTARSPWEQSEAFLWGPVKKPNDLDGAMDDWPSDLEGMQEVVKASTPITPEVITANDNTRGFHLIEFLIWGEDGNNPIKAEALIDNGSNKADRKKEYLEAASVDLKTNTQTLYSLWEDANGFKKEFLNPALTNDTYKSTKNALSQIVSGLWTIADEVGASKITKSFNPKENNGNPDPSKEESRFSNNTRKDFADNMRSIQNVYLGKFDYAGKQGKGLTDLIKKLDPQLDAKIKAQIEKAIADIQAIPVSYADAIINNRPAVAKAQATVLELREIIQKELGKYYNVVEPKED